MISDLQCIFFEEKLSYTGSELRPHFILEKTKTYGSCILAFVGECEVKTEALVDQEDRLKSDFIRAKLMLHFLGEFYGMSLREAVFFQRRIVTLLKESLEELHPEFRCTQSGDDLFFEDGKLTVSIVAPSISSMLFHLGVNIDADGAPVKTASFSSHNINPKTLADLFFKKVKAEWDGVHHACVKVRGVMD